MSVMASWAKACTESDLSSAHHHQQQILEKMVESMMRMALKPMVTAVLSGFGSRNNFLKDSSPTWRNEIMMMTEKINTPKGSSRVSPIGYAIWVRQFFVLESSLAMKMMNVDKKSRMESTNDATTDNEFVRSEMTILPTNNTKLIKKLTMMAKYTWRPNSSSLLPNNWPASPMFPGTSLIRDFELFFAMSVASAWMGDALPSSSESGSVYVESMLRCILP